MAVLERLAEAVSLRDGYLDEALIQWAIDPMNNRSVAKGYQYLQQAEKVLQEVKQQAATA